MTTLKEANVIEANIVYELSERIVKAQAPLRILDAIKWGPEIEETFFANKAQVLPAINAEYYQTANKLSFNIKEKTDEFLSIHSDVQRALGQFNPLGNIMQRICNEYILSLAMLQHRGTDEFGRFATNLYGSTDEAFYAGGPNVRDVADLLIDKLPALKLFTDSEADIPQFTAQEAARQLQIKLQQYFDTPPEKNLVEISSTIVSDAAAGAETIKLRSNAMFSQRDIRLLEVHEGWVHLATTINGYQQPICTFLSKGTPVTAITQEGLAVLMEVFTFSMYPKRLQRLLHRIIGIAMANDGANFIEVYRYYLSQEYSERDAYKIAMRVFRGSYPQGKPFTKDISYIKGFIMIYNYLRLAIQENRLDLIAMLFIGKTRLEDLHIYSGLVEQGLITPPKFIPPQFSDLAALSTWMCFSLFFRQLDIHRMMQDYKQIVS